MAIPRLPRRQLLEELNLIWALSIPQPRIQRVAFLSSAILRNVVEWILQQTGGRCYHHIYFYDPHRMEGLGRVSDVYVVGKAPDLNDGTYSSWLCYIIIALFVPLTYDV